MTFSRRASLKFAGKIALGAFAAGAGVKLSARVAQSQSAAARRRIDTHHHVFPPPYVAALIEGKQDAQIAKAWSVARTLDDMERAGVGTSIVSLTQPAVTFAPAAVARRVARESNEWPSTRSRPTASASSRAIGIDGSEPGDAGARAAGSADGAEEILLVRILFGSDYPYRTGEDQVKGLMEYGFSAADLRAIERDNAVRLIPRLRG